MKPNVSQYKLFVVRKLRRLELDLAKLESSGSFPVEDISHIRRVMDLIKIRMDEGAGNAELAILFTCVSREVKPALEKVKYAPRRTRPKSEDEYSPDERIELAEDISKTLLKLSDRTTDSQTRQDFLDLEEGVSLAAEELRKHLKSGDEVFIALEHRELINQIQKVRNYFRAHAFGGAK